jgi:uncharacterized protein (DUF58 family)
LETLAAITPQAADLIALRGWVGRPRPRFTRAPGGGGGTEGPRRGGLRGRGLDFAELRAYQPGDDVRSIDWRHAARHGLPATRLYREERDRCLRLLVDLGPSMQFGTRVAYKSVIAARAAALAGWSAAANGDRVGGLVWHGGLWTESPMQARRAGVLGVIRELSDTASVSATQAPSLFNDGLHRLGSKLSSSDQIIIISDFRFLDAAAEALLVGLGRRAGACHFLHIHDPFEATPPPPGDYSLSDGATQATIDFADPWVRQAHAAAFDAHCRRVKTLASGSGSRWMQLATDSPLSDLATCLSR